VVAELAQTVQAGFEELSARATGEVAELARSAEAMGLGISERAEAGLAARSSSRAFCHCTSPLLVGMDNPYIKINDSDG
jgi:hypothetical protein